jgi:hypothetical protein
MGGMSIGSHRLDFSQALIEARHNGRKLSRDAWYNDGVFVVYQKAYPEGIGINGNTAEATGIPQGTRCAFKPYLMIRMADGSFVPWTASQNDLLALDWFTSDWKANQVAATGEAAAAEDALLPDGVNCITAMYWAARGYEVGRNDWGGMCVYAAVLADGTKTMRAEGGRPWYPTQEDQAATDWYVTIKNEARS